jgi:glycosyltransferase involved in cell wall biosynthesis
MKLLILSSNLERAGFRQRIAIYLDILCSNGIECEVAKLPAGPLARLKLFRRAPDFDVVLLHKKGLNPFDAFWLRRYSKKLIYHFDDAIMYSTKTPDHNSRSHLARFRRSARSADMVIAASAYLAEHALKFNPNVTVLATGIKISDYKFDRHCEKDDKVRLVWIGSKATLEYLVTIKPALEEIGSHFNNVVLRIICDDFFDLENMPVEKFRWSQKTRGGDLAECDIGLAPLPDDRFTQGKCSFKVLEYAAAGLPVVASPVGANVDNIREGVTGFFATDYRNWVGRITQLIKDTQLRERMGKQALVHAEKYDISVIGKQLTDLLSGCLRE